MDGPSFSSSSSDHMDNSNIYNSDELNNYIDCSDEDFSISDLSSVLHNMYSSSERTTPQSTASEIKNSVLDSLLTEKQKNIDIYKSSPISTFTCSEICTYAPGTLFLGGEISLFVNILFKHFQTPRSMEANNHQVIP